VITEAQDKEEKDALGFVSTLQGKDTAAEQTHMTFKQDKQAQEKRRKNKFREKTSTISREQGEVRHSTGTTQSARRQIGKQRTAQGDRADTISRGQGEARRRTSTERETADRHNSGQRKATGQRRGIRAADRAQGDRDKRVNMQAAEGRR
jgi:hypothetical protein